MSTVYQKLAPCKGGVVIAPTASQRRLAAIQGHSRPSGMDLDEYPPAIFKEGGAGASVRAIPSHENRAFGAMLMWKLRNVRDGTSVEIEIVP